MKKILSLIVFAIIFSGNLFSQDCLNDIYYTVVNQKAFGKAIKMMDKNCFPGNEDKAQVWLMRANSYLYFSLSEFNKKIADTNYIPKNPEYIYYAFESFRKAIELDNNIDQNVKAGLENTRSGQGRCALLIHDLGKQTIKDANYTKAIEYILAAQKCYILGKPAETDSLGMIDYEINMFETYFDLSRCYQALKDNENYKINIKKAVGYDQDYPPIYFMAYNFFNETNDSIENVKLIKRIKRLSVKTDQLQKKINYYMLELAYYDRYEMKDSLKQRSIKMVETVGVLETNKKFLSDVIVILQKQFLPEEAEQIVDMYLSQFPKDYEMMQSKGFNNLIKAQLMINEIELLDQSDLSKTEMEKKKNECIAKKNQAFEEVIKWYQKIYEINPDDPETIKYLCSTMKRLGKTVDPVLDEKFTKIINGTTPQK
jgi:tetratricopeptide (TPR) repeat protein